MLGSARLSRLDMGGPAIIMAVGGGAVNLNIPRMIRHDRVASWPVTVASAPQLWLGVDGRATIVLYGEEKRAPRYIQ